MNGRCRLFKVNGIVGPANVQTFNDETGKQWTIQEYYRNKNYQLRFPNLPCVSAGTVKIVCLPLELCKVQPGQDVRKKLGKNQVQKLIIKAATSTSERKTKIINIFSLFRYNENEIIRGFNLSINPEFVELLARIIPPPIIKYRNSTEQPIRGSWRPRRAVYLQSAQIGKWGILVTTEVNESAVARFADMVNKEAAKNQMNIDRNYKRVTEMNGRYLLDKLKEFKEAGCSIVFVIISDSEDSYAKVKQKAEKDLHMLTQCIKSNTVEQKGTDLSTISNIFLKVNSKLNGVNHQLQPASSIKMIYDAKNAIMFLGADVTHPSPDQSHIPSVVGVVASFDSLAFQYKVCWRLQNPREEMIQDMENIMREQLLFFKEQRKILPTHIIYYRDGVSDGQFAQLRSVELNAINRACSGIQSNYKPKVTCLVVQKRHHTRFFPISADSVDPRDENENVLPGTVVDTTITHPGEKQFFLVSHQSHKGTAKPSKYCIIRDDSNIGADDLEAMTYSLCYMFTRCNRAVSYPAPAYYAHRVAARGRVYIKGCNIDMGNLQREYNSRNVDRIIKSNPMFFV